MPEDRPRLVAPLALLAVLGLSVLAFAPAATADSHANGMEPYVIEQGDQCVDVDPVVDRNQSVVEFYDYRHPNSSPSATTYSSYGTTEYQADNASILMLYRGSQGTSLVIVHEKFHEPPSDGTNGSSATFTVTGLSPDDDGWVVEDDDYPAQDDTFDHYDTYSEMDWLWSQGRTDGGVYRGLEGDVEIGIDPAFNESAERRYGGHYGGYVHDWQVITATDDGFERVSLDSLTRNVTIHDGYCAPPPNASLAVGDATPEVGATTVTLDASGSESPSGVTEFRWDLAGNDSLERVTTDPTIDHVFETPGERNATVTVVAGDGQTDAVAVPINVTDETAPTARLDVPAAATVDEELAFSANESTDNHRIASYDWTLGDGTTADRPAVNLSYGSPGVYDVSLTVADPAGHTATANATIEVSRGPPNASLTVPRAATVNDSVTLDASATTAGPNASYEWFVDGTSVDVTDSPISQAAFATTGDHRVTVTVTDANGSDAATATVTVGTGSDGDDGSEGDDSDDEGSDDASGGGGYAPPPQPDPVEASVAVVNGTVVVTAENVRAGEAFSVDVPANATVETAPGTNGPGAAATGANAWSDVVALRSVEVTPATDADAFEIRFDPAQRGVPGRFTESSAIVSNATAAVETVTYELGVDRSTISAAGVSADDLTAYGYDDGWASVRTEKAVDGDRIVATATVRGERPLGVGAVGPVLFVRDVRTAGLLTNGTVALETTVHNTGTEPVDATLPIAHDDERVAAPLPALAPGEEAVLETTVPIAGADDAAVHVAGRRWALTVVVVTDLSVSPSEPGPNETVTVAAELHNRGSVAGEIETPLRFDGQVVAAEPVSLAPGERTTVTFEQRTSAPGHYAFAVGDTTATANVSARAGFSDGDAEQTESATPGFGVLGAIAALLAVALLALRRRRE